MKTKDLNTLINNVGLERQDRYDKLIPLIDRALCLDELASYKYIAEPKYPWWDIFFLFLLRRAPPRCPDCQNQLYVDVLFYKEREFTGTSCLSISSSISNARSIKKRFWEAGYIPWYLTYYNCLCGYEFACWEDAHFLPRPHPQPDKEID